MVKIVNDIQKFDRSPVPKLVVHKIHRPYLIHRFRHAQFLRFTTLQVFSGLAAQVQLQLPVNLIHARMVPDITFYVVQIEKAEAKFPVALCLRQSKKMFSNQAVLSGRKLNIRKAHMWQYANQYPLNERQRAIINRLLAGFEGKLTSGKYAKLTKCSPDTALRDIRELMEYGILRQGESGGRSTSYALVEKAASQ